MVRLALIGFLASTALHAQPAFFGQILGTATSGRTLYASTNAGGYFKSVDDGLTWTPVYIAEAGTPQPPNWGFVIDPLNEVHLYVLTSPEAGGFWKSTDAGRTWIASNTGLPESPAATLRELHVSSNGTLYARLDNFIYKSTDRAATWTRIATPLPAPGTLDINFSNPSQMIVQRQGTVWRSVDEGRSWNATTSLGFPFNGTVKSDPLFPNRLYISLACGCNAAGLYRSIDAGASFLRPPQRREYPGVLVDQRGGPNVFVNSSTGGSCVSSNFGEVLRCFGAEKYGADVRPTSDSLDFIDRFNLLYSSAVADNAQQLLFRSRDAGESWQRMRGTARVTLTKPARLAISLAPGGTITIPLPVTVSDLAGAAIPYTAESTGEEWFTLANTGGTTPTPLSLRFSAEGLEPGEYRSEIRIASPQAFNESVTVPVMLRVARQSSSPAPQYEITEIAGNGRTAPPVDGGPATESSIGTASAITVDRNRNVYFISTTQNRIRRITADGKLETVAGTGATGVATDGTPARNAALNRPANLAVDSRGLVYFGENNRIMRRINANGALETVLAQGRLTFEPNSYAVDSQDRVWLANSQNLLRYSQPNALVPVTLNPRPTLGAGRIAIEPTSGTIYLLNSASTGNVVYRVSAQGTTEVIAGNGSDDGAGEGVPALSTGFRFPSSVAADRRGNLFVLESTGNASAPNRIRMINRAGIAYTIAQPEGRTLSQIAAGDDGAIYASSVGYILKLTPPAQDPPELTSGPLNLASGEEVVSPGTLFYLEGSNLAAGGETAEEGQWKTVLAGTTVTINGIEALLASASPGRVSGQIPSELPPGPGSVVLTVNGLASESRAFELSEASPAMFGVPEVASGMVSMFVTGFGRHNNGLRVTLDDGSEVHSPRLALVPGFPGLARLTFRLPQGPHKVVLSVAGVAGKVTFILIP